ncbi:MAG: hypothetical protein JST39_11250, partial [Bacteroidetes bacterium]|nr:hypothetical protein [Bacteroidota bacterium]
MLQDTVRQRTFSSWYNGMATLTGPNTDNICLDSGYTMGMRIKIMSNNIGGEFLQTGWGAATLFRREFGWPYPRPGIYVGKFEYTHPGDDVMLGTLYGYSGFTYLIADSNVNAIYDWMEIMIKVVPSHIYLYFNGRQILDNPLNPSIPINPLSNLGFAILTRDFAVDWVKIMDHHGVIKYFEDFVDPDHPAQADPGIFCSAPEDCQTAFTSYFNTKYSTAYTYAQIDSVYRQQGVKLSACTISYSDTCGQSSRFINTYGGNDTTSLADTKATADGGYISAGKTKSYGASGTDGYLVKTDAKGTVLWSKRYGKQYSDGFTNVQSTTDGGYVMTGTVNADTTGQHGQIWVVKTDASGNTRWSKKISAGSTGGESGVNVVQTKDGGYAVTGHYNYGNSSSDLLVVKLDTAGTQVWNRRFSTTNANHPGGLIEEGDSLLVGATYNNGTDNDGALVKLHTKTGTVGWSQGYDIGSKYNRFRGINRRYGYYTIISQLADDNADAGQRECVLNIDNYGAPVSAFKINTPGGAASTANSWTAPADGAGYITAETGPSSGDLYIRKMDNAGTAVWANRIKLDGNQQVSRVLQNTDGTIVIAGTSDNNMLLVKADSLGRTFCSDTAAVVGDSSASVSVHSYPYTMDSLTLTIAGVDTLGVDAPFTAFAVCNNNACALPLVGPTLCGRAAPIFPPVTQAAIDNCSDNEFFAVSKGTELYYAYRDSLINAFDSIYRSKCMQAYKLESFTVTRTVSQYHYTLYYYDQAGNLVKTIAPAGVRANFDSLWLDSVKTARLNGTSKVPGHIMPTQYRYNTLNQVVAQQTPDAGLSQFWYDRLGRLALSQNARQAVYSPARQYSYTQYDYLGRITEVGQINDTTATGAMTDSISRSENLLSSWLLALTNKREQVTRTVYDLAYPAAGTLPLDATNLRNRVAYTTFTLGNSSSAYNQATFYSYDIHGNVDTLLQDYGSSLYGSTVNIMNANSARWKRIIYQYDLISGKVNMVMYNTPFRDPASGDNTNPPDMFFHRYSYDAENRLTSVETSPDSVIWEKDARYEYYLHGPLARTVLGEQQVQGLDYAYTIQGWLKGMNSSTLRSTYDMGEDGAISGQHQYIAKDAVGFNLNYFNNDYAPVKNSMTPFANAAALGSAGRPLYNGNISSMAVNIGALNQPYLYKYNYDQLNRLTGQDSYTGL